MDKQAKRPQCPLRTLPLGVPLAIASVGTVATLFTGNKQLHTAFGVAWAALSLLHGWQHAQKMQHDLTRAQEFLRTGIAPEGQRPDAYTLALARARAYHVV